VRRLALALATTSLVTIGAAAATAGKPQVSGSATIANEKITLRYATAFVRESVHGASGAYAIVLTPRPVRCADLRKLPDESPLRQPWALVALFPTPHGAPGTGRVRGEVNYPVGDAYAVVARGVSIVLQDAVPFPGAVWTGRVAHSTRVVEGERYALSARFNARWCP
jgi:hypothetical protein